MGGKVEFQEMKNIKRSYVMNLRQLMKKTCNESTGVSVEDMMGKFLEALYIMLFFRGD